MELDLEAYRRKRRFESTPEPRGRKAPPAADRPRFVVQRHLARRPHFDLRLEIGGTLKSWAVPRGPSLDPRQRRLAVRTEDHPLEYAEFEGVIPRGEYGAGPVAIWDRGFVESRSSLEEGLRSGRLYFILDGKRLKGEFALVRKQGAEREDWLLIKKRDDFATEEDPTLDQRSIVSGRRAEDLLGPPADAPEGPMPRGIDPMKALLVEAPFSREGWFFEPKWDGYRAVAEVAGPEVRLYSRKGLPLGSRYPEIVSSLAAWGRQGVLDGEIVALDARGRPVFQWLQDWAGRREGTLVYYVFDLLYLDGRDLRGLPLRRRKELLRAALPELPGVRFGAHVEEDGERFFAEAVRLGLEGMVAKDASSAYEEGRRSGRWVKVKSVRRQEALVCGFTQPGPGRRGFGALVLGAYEGGRLVHIGNVGSGFDDKALASLRSRLEPLVRPDPPFERPPAEDLRATWTRPELACEVRFSEWTEGGRMRQPVFLGLRPDVAPGSVRRERALPLEQVLPEPPGRFFGRTPPESSEGPAERIDLGGRVVTLARPGKPLFPGISKSDLAAYYRKVAPAILRYLKDRPLTLLRHPDGAAGDSFFQKSAPEPRPEWVRTHRVASASGGREIEYVVCEDEATLLWLTNLGCIELNPWNSRAAAPDRPDYAVLDLDPEEAPFERVVETAQALRGLLEEAGIPSACKTSGKRGLHVCVPLGARYTHEEARLFSEIVARLVHARLPATTSVVRSPKRRRGKVYLDYLQNGRTQTLACAYCARPVPEASVSTPLRWEEVRPGLDPRRFTVRDVPERLARVGDLWAPVLGPGIDMEEALDRLRKL